MEDKGFYHVSVLGYSSIVNGVHLIPTPCRHSERVESASKNPAVGVIFQKAGLPTVYLVGDTMYYHEITKAIQTFSPKIAILNAGGNTGHHGRFIMGKEGVLQARLDKLDMKLIVVHLEGVNHWMVSRKELRRFVEDNGFSNQVLIPDDGEYFNI